MLPAKQIVRSFIPPQRRQAIRVASGRMLYYGTGRYCPCCRSRVRRFHPFGQTARPNACCPVCGALERHRLVAVFLERNAELLDGVHRLLHVAPEPQLSVIFRQWPELEYLSVDFEPGRAMACMDITDLRFDDASFDALFCSHVLEHVADDRRAMAEFHRVLSTGGWAMLQVPTQLGQTVEDPSINDPERRRRLFGQPDHVRVYGQDFPDRLAEAGFAVSVYRAADWLRREEVRKSGLNPNEEIFLCRKPD